MVPKGLLVPVPVEWHMECKECGTNIDFEVHENYVCFDCWCQMDTAAAESEIQKKTSAEEE